MFAARACWLVIVFGCAARVAAEETFFQPEFFVQTVASGFVEPVAIEFAPDGRLFVAERNGTVRIVENGLPSAAAVAEVTVFTDNENGLLGMALDPNFAATGYVYLFATVERDETRILRATVGGSPTDLTVIRDRLPTRGQFHSGGGLKFGPDGKLYFSIGDNTIATNGQDLSTLAGKISRINPDGTTPSDNPFTTSTGLPRATYALGFRNPFRFCFAPDGRIFALDVGSDAEARREEINLVRAGGNYGWPIAEGYKPAGSDPNLIDPIHTYSDGGAAPVGAVYYTGTQFPAEYRGNLFHLEYVLNRLYRVVLDGDRVVSHELFMQGVGGPLDLVQGLDGALYYCEFETGLIKRVASTRAPDTVPQPADTSDPAPADPNSAIDGVTSDDSAGEPDDDALGPATPLFTLCGFGVLPAGLLCLTSIALWPRRH